MYMSKRGGEASPIELLEVYALAELIKMTDASVRKAKERGHQPTAAKIPGVGLRWRRSDVETWLERRFETAAAAP